jgi:hypothetical protein
MLAVQHLALNLAFTSLLEIVKPAMSVLHFAAHSTARG